MSRLWAGWIRSLPVVRGLGLPARPTRHPLILGRAGRGVIGRGSRAIAVIPAVRTLIRPVPSPVVRAAARPVRTAGIPVLPADESQVILTTRCPGTMPGGAPRVVLASVPGIVAGGDPLLLGL